MKTLLATFKSQILQALPDAEAVAQTLENMTAKDWKPLAEVYAATLPEADTIMAVAGAEALAQEVGRIRGLDVVMAGQPVSLAEGAGVLVITAHLLGGEAEIRTINQLAPARAVAVVAAVERTNMGARSLLGERGVKVLAALQLADTPAGLIVERRSPQRWTVPARSA